MRTFLIFLVAGLVGLPTMAAGAADATAVGPSASRQPYLVPRADGVTITTLLSAGDEVPHGLVDEGRYTMVGLPDGMGALANDDETFWLWVVHELPAERGVRRRHGGIGAFISAWRITTPDHPAGGFHVLSGYDQIADVTLWDPLNKTFTNPERPVVFDRLRSADLPPSTAWYDWGSGKGRKAEVILAGEKSDPQSRAFLHMVRGEGWDGISYELPWLGQMHFQNIVAHPHPQPRTVIAALDDRWIDQVYFLVGDKFTRRELLSRIGIAEGQLHGLRIEGKSDELADSFASGDRFTLVPLGDVTTLTQEELDARSDEADVARFGRPEDGCWDPTTPGRFYFASAGRKTPDGTYPTRLWRLDFDDIRNPTAGGTLHIILDETTHPELKRLDNVLVDHRGDIWLQEDSGTDPRLARVWRLKGDDPEAAPELIAEANPDFFSPGGEHYLTTREDAVGLIDLHDIVGPGYYLTGMHSHLEVWDPEDPAHAAHREKLGMTEAQGFEIVEDGQLMIIHVAE